MCIVHVLYSVQGSAICVQERAPAGVDVGSFEHVKRDKRERVRGVRRGALRGEPGGVGEREDEE